MPPSADWETLGDGGQGDAFYRRITLYELPWNGLLPGGGDLSDYLLVAARNGGPLAITRDDSKPVLLRDSNAAAVPAPGSSSSSSSSKKKRIWVFSASGILLQSLVWDHTSKIVRLGFTANESLVALAKDGTYRLYPVGGPLGDRPTASVSSTGTPSYSQHSLTHDVQDAHVVDARVYDSGMVLLLSNHQFLEVKGWPERDLSSSLDAISSPSDGDKSAHGRGRVERFVPSYLEASPASWCVLTSEQSTSRQVEVLLSAGDSLLSIDQLDVQDLHFSRGPFSHITPSPSGRFFAALTPSTSSRPGKLYVVSSTFSETLSEYDLSNESHSTPPKSVLWCGNNSVLLVWETEVVMVGPFGQTLRYYYMDPVHVISEVDGVRIISIDKCEFLHKVPASTTAVFQPGSVHPSAILYEAYEEFVSKNAHAHESISNIRADLVEAVDTCIDAAGREWEVEWQKKLLKAASFGKTFLDLYNPVDFVAMSQTLRVLNAVRYYEIGMPITYDQYITHSPSTLIQRLTLRNRHLLALRISAFLKLSTAPILKHWSLLKVRQSRNDQDDALEVATTIVKRLREENDKAVATHASLSAPSAGSTGAGTGSPFVSQVSCADVARTAWEDGKTILATRLLEYEPRASKQVHLLLSMKEDNAALLKAIRSGDSDLILSVLLSLRKQHALGTFFRFLDNKDEAIAVLTNYCKKYDRELIKDFWFQDDRRVENACFELELAAAIGTSDTPSAATTASTEGLTAEQFSEKMDRIRSAGKSFGEDKERGFEAKMCDDHLKLLAFQQQLQTEAGTSGSASARPPFVGLSVSETIRQCIINGWGKKAEKVRSDFKVPDKRWWYIKIKALVEIRDFDQLEQFAKSKRSPVGYEPFVETLIDTGNTRQALNYIPRCEGRNKVDLYLKAGEWLKAGEECRDRGERGRLNDLIQRSPNNIVASQLSSLLEDTRTY